MNLPNPSWNELRKGHKNYKIAFKEAMRYYYATFSDEDMKIHVQTWLNRTFKSVPAAEFRNIGPISWIINNCAYVHPKVLEHTSKKVNKFYRTGKNLLTIMEEDTPQEKYKKKTKNIISELEVFFDNVLHNRTIEKPLSEIVESYDSFDSGNVLNHFTKLDKMMDVKYRNNLELRNIAHRVLGEITTKLLFSSPENT